MTKKYTIKGFALKNKESGTWPSSESAIRAYRAFSPENGFGEVFITVGRRVLVDEDKFWEAISKHDGDKKKTWSQNLKNSLKKRLK